MRKRILALVLAVMLLVPVLAGCSGGDKIVIASKNYTENQILAEMMAQLIEENTDITVQRKINMGGTLVCFEAIKKGEVDIYPEYTGTALMEELKLPVNNDPDEVYDTVKQEFASQFNIKWLDELGFNNTYALAISKDVAEDKGIKSISDLVPLSGDYVFGAEQEFFNREDGYPGLIEVYGLTFKNVSQMDISLKYQAVNQGTIQVTNAFSTDGMLKAMELTVLEDDKGFFPPYYAAPIVRQETLDKYPELEDLLNKLGGLIDDVTMQGLNYRADNENVSIKQVAADFLKENGLIG